MNSSDFNEFVIKLTNFQNKLKDKIPQNVINSYIQKILDLNSTSLLENNNLQLRYFAGIMRNDMYPIVKIIFECPKCPDLTSFPDCLNHCPFCVKAIDLCFNFVIAKAEISPNKANTLFKYEDKILLLRYIVHFLCVLKSI